jgi:hypothetical protein
MVRPLPFGWLRKVFANIYPKCEGTYVFEYGACNAEQMFCQPPVLGSWFIDKSGCRPVDVLPKDVPLDRSGMWYRFSQVSFYIEPAGTWFVLSCINGPRAGYVTKL